MRHPEDAHDQSLAQRQAQRVPQLLGRIADLERVAEALEEGFGKLFLRVLQLEQDSHAAELSARADEEIAGADFREAAAKKLDSYLEDMADAKDDHDLSQPLPF